MQTNTNTQPTTMPHQICIASKAIQAYNIQLPNPTPPKDTKQAIRLILPSMTGYDLNNLKGIPGTITFETMDWDDIETQDHRELQELHIYTIYQHKNYELNWHLRYTVLCWLLQQISVITTEFAGGDDSYYDYAPDMFTQLAFSIHALKEILHQYKPGTFEHFTEALENILHMVTDPQYPEDTEQLFKLLKDPTTDPTWCWVQLEIFNYTE